MKNIIIGTRGSKLALTQANNIKDRLLKLGYNSEIKIITTSGDKNQNIFREIPLKKLFVKEIEEELLEGSIDIAVHSMKDMPYEEVEGLVIGAYPEREDPRDAMLIGKEEFRVVGTGSERRRVQVEEIYNNIETKPIRGNVDTRIKKMHDGDYDAIILACAGLKRLGLEKHINKVFSVDEMVPSPCQGTLAIQCRATDTKILEVLAKLDNEDIRKSVEIERIFGKLYNGGCQSPIGAYAKVEGDNAKVWVMRYEGKIIKRFIEGNKNNLEYFEEEFKKVK